MQIKLVQIKYIIDYKTSVINCRINTYYITYDMKGTFNLYSNTLGKVMQYRH